MTKTESKSTKSTKTAKVVKTFSVKDLISKIQMDPKKTRQMIRDMRSVDAVRFSPPESKKSYAWSARDFAIVTKKIETEIARRELECNTECTHSTSTKCNCSCGGKNHGMHVIKSKSERKPKTRSVAPAASDSDGEDDESDE